MPSPGGRPDSWRPPGAGGVGTSRAAVLSGRFAEDFGASAGLLVSFGPVLAGAAGPAGPAAAPAFVVGSPDSPAAAELAGR
ncbi:MULTISPECIES: hypothetical protein [Mycolicibacter]|uniref:Uncharacterized protein n=2 Tax=Mycolicibacter TaxID=1073531 RepID=A0ABU5XL96_9MYCO|nr:MULTISPECIES: hypothetical protein [unclassified Mycolicibacter]MEB3022948.1 hypothetical protein [Mycolicibacter sp. MYC098]MEB3035140.1 hypothetical protein [Mycolicibacter sp. MYC340]